MRNWCQFQVIEHLELLLLKLYGLTFAYDYMNISISIIRGDDAHKTRNLAEFINQWLGLAANSRHVSAFQRPEFINRWYKHYAPEYEPVLVLGHNRNGQLIGLLPLAINYATNKLTHAADQQVEYSGWLADPDYDQEFISKAVATISKNIDYSYWRWSHMPPYANTDWLLAPSHHLSNVDLHYEIESSPVLDLHDEEKINKIKKNKSIKSKINRLKRKGELYIEHITDPDRAKAVLQQTPDLVNFRHGAAHGDLAFKEDPLQYGFYASRCDDLTSNHFSALWLGDTLLAFHFGCIDNDTLFIGLTAFDPRESKHSPGVIFILYLAEMMQQQGIRFIDLTPGRDEYKQRFCNMHHTLFRPIVFSSTFEKIKYLSIGHAKSSVFSILSMFGLDRETIVKKLQSNNKAASSTQDYYLLNMQLTNSNEEYSNNQSTQINIQKYNDLLIHQGYSSSLEMQALLSDATQRFSKEETLVTLMENDKLVAYGWLSKIGAKYKNHGLELNLDKDSIVLDCIEVEKVLPNEAVLEKMMKFMLNYARELGATKAFSYVPKFTDKAKLGIIENLGFKTAS